MAGNLLSIGKSGLFAAQAGLSTTGHNISNANVAGYSRQTVVQSSAMAQDFGYGFVGSGTQVADIKRYSDAFLNTQVRNAQSSLSSLEAYNSQISQIDNLLADTTSGLSPALQNFFTGLHNLAANPSSTAARQAVLSNAESLASRFQSLDGRMQEIRDGVNAQVTTKVTLINSYASQIADLNEQIGKFTLANGNAKPNDLMDARDQLVLELNKEIKANVTPGANNSLTISIGVGMPLVVGSKQFELAVATSPTDLARVQVGYMTGNKMTVLADSSLSGGALGGLLEFRTNTLDRAQNSLGRIAIGIAETFNAQHKLGLDSKSAMGGDFFTIGEAVVGASLTNTPVSNPALAPQVKAAIVDSSKLTHSDYKVEYKNGSYWVSSTSGGAAVEINPFPQTQPQEIFGIAFDIKNAATEGDYFIVRPTIGGAANFNVAIKDIAQIAAGAPVVTNTPLGNKGSAKISEGSISKEYLAGAPTLPLTLNFDAASGELQGFPAGSTVYVTSAGGTPQPFVVGTDPILFKAGDNYNIGGVNVSFTGKPAEGDTFKISANTNGASDNRNAHALGKLQTKTILDGGTATYQSAYAELVSFIGNKTREVQVNGDAGEALLSQVRASQQEVSGVNLDEEASNLLKYQQAYQAAGKVMQIASTLFDTLLSLR
ncbi:flagellar hook-associated protein FlgK [Massilia sp. RP-1-19]|uniref:Flagellar hook-associated protein 1 n=1 Tax=Massilia polaris TaxID=2728846 RepID=A0A848HV71_9BURK|nr:flagellar hook-associated protein FlgK [Massilia polaris]NML63163.1 flagellar hook-associated protein FlgK [Massilia polaris]